MYPHPVSCHDRIMDRGWPEIKGRGKRSASEFVRCDSLTDGEAPTRYINSTGATFTDICQDRWCALDSAPDQNQRTPWPIATFQSVLLQSIFALLLAGDQAAFDLSLRYRIQTDEYELLLALVQTCRRSGIFFYPKMLARHSATAPLAMVWVSVEEIKRFGLALYKVCRMATSAGVTDGRDELLTLADLSFSLPDSDELWDADSGAYSRISSQTTTRDNRDPNGWISTSAGVLDDAGVNFDWI